MIPRWILFVLLGLGIYYVLRPKRVPAQLSANPNWDKGMPDLGGVTVPPVSSIYQNQASAPIAIAPESTITYGAGGWLNALTGIVNDVTRKNCWGGINTGSPGGIPGEYSFGGENGVYY